MGGPLSSTNNGGLFVVPGVNTIPLRTRPRTRISTSRRRCREQNWPIGLWYAHHHSGDRDAPDERVVMIVTLALLAECVREAGNGRERPLEARRRCRGCEHRRRPPQASSGNAEMNTPESVRYDPELDVFFVSNINGNPSQHDGNGFIAVVRADSTGVVTKCSSRVERMARSSTRRRVGARRRYAVGG